jgi:hypothetical protein
MRGAKAAILSDGSAPVSPCIGFGESLASLGSGASQRADRDLRSDSMENGVIHLPVSQFLGPLQFPVIPCSDR